MVRYSVDYLVFQLFILFFSILNTIICNYLASSPVGGFEEAGKKFIESIAKQGCRLASAAGPDHALPVRAEEAGSSAWTQAGDRSAWRPTDGDDDLGVRASIRGITEYFQSWLP